jgi:ketosteroid isomerase-like protein
MRRGIQLSLIVLVTILCLPVLAGAGDAEDVIAVTKAQWAADMAKDAEKGAAILADDYTEFNADFPTRIDGKALATRLTEATSMGSGKVVAAEMANPKVQVNGNVAILTYNYFGVMMDGDGETEPSLAKSTRVYVKTNGKWMLVHANFAPVGSSDD